MNGTIGGAIPAGTIGGAIPAGTIGGAIPADTMGRELGEGPRAVSGTLAEVERVRPELGAALGSARRIVLVGTGASLAAIRTAAPLWRRRLSASADPLAGDRSVAEIVVRQSAEAVLGELDGLHWRSSDLVIAVSQSGTSPETLRAARDARDLGAALIAVTAHPESPLATGADLVLTLASGVESDASTKSALATLAALLATGGLLAGGGTPADLLSARLQAIVDDPAWARRAGGALARAEHTWLVGFGAGLGIAEAGALLWHEKVVRPAVAATPSEFRHGLIEAVEAGDGVVLIDVDDPRTARADYLRRLCRELDTLGAGLLELTFEEPAGPIGSAERALEALLRIQQLAHATAVAGATYRDGFEVLRRVVEPATELTDPRLTR